MRGLSTLLAAAGLATFAVSAQAAYCGSDSQDVQFVRSDVATIKAHMQAVLAALGTLPAPYARVNDSWQLPSSSCRDKAGFAPVPISYSGRFSAEASQQKLAQSYQQQIMAAQARGDYAGMAKISQQMQAQYMQAAAVAQASGPVEVNITANGSTSGTIDPDSVLRDGEGFIALREPGGDLNSETVSVYFDKVQLKNAHQLASYDLGSGWRVPDKLALMNVRIQLSGPKASVERLLKQLDTDAVRGELTAQRTQPTGGSLPGC